MILLGESGEFGECFFCVMDGFGDGCCDCCFCFGCCYGWSFGCLV